MTKNDGIRVKDFENNYSWLGDIPVWKALALADMAARDVYPDGTFSDNECVVWSKFHRIFTLKDKKDSII